MGKAVRGGGAEEFVTTAELAEALDLTPGRIRQKARAGEITGELMIAGRRLFRRDAVSHLLAGKPRNRTRRRARSSE